MSKYLVIIEGPGKIKKFTSALGKDYKVLATFCHNSIQSCVVELMKNGIVKFNESNGKYEATI